MKTYYLKPIQINETLRKVDVYTKQDAIEYFSKIKQLAQSDLLKLYEVTETE